MQTAINGATTMPYSLEQDIATASAAGFDGIEIWRTKLGTYLETHSPAELAQRLAEAGLKPITICPLTIQTFKQPNDQAHKDLITYAQIAQQINCPVILVCPDAPAEQMDKEEAFEKAGAETAYCCDLVAEYGVSLCIEPLGRHKLVPGPVEAMELMRRADRPNLGLMMDTFHYYKSEVPFSAIEAISTEKLLVVHVNDCIDKPRAELTDADRVYPTLGVIPAAKMINIVKRNGYGGALSVEIFNRSYWEGTPEEISNQSKRYLDALMRELQV